MESWISSADQVFDVVSVEITLDSIKLIWIFIFNFCFIVKKKIRFEFIAATGSPGLGADSAAASAALVQTVAVAVVAGGAAFVAGSAGIAGVVRSFFSVFFVVFFRLAGGYHRARVADVDQYDARNSRRERLGATFDWINYYILV